MILHNASSAAFNVRLSQIKLWFNYCGFEETQLPTRNVVFNDMRPSLLRDASVEASPESSHFPVAWPGLTPEGRRSACVKQSSGTRRQGQGSGNQETSTAASPTPRHPSSPEQPRLARAGCSCEHARPDLGWRPAHPRHNPKFLSRPEPWEGADRYHVSHAKVV